MVIDLEKGSSGFGIGDFVTDFLKIALETPQSNTVKAILEDWGMATRSLLADIGMGDAADVLIKSVLINDFRTAKDWLKQKHSHLTDIEIEDLGDVMYRKFTEAIGNGREKGTGYFSAPTLKK